MATTVTRDAHGILTGELDYGRRSAPITVLSHIVPLIFECANCKSPALHVIGEQPYGLTLGFMGLVTFTRKPIATFGKWYHLICNECSYIAAGLTKEALAKLENGMIPAALCAAYTPNSIYTDGYAQFLDEMLYGILNMTQVLGQTNENREYLKECLDHYRREV